MCIAVKLTAKKYIILAHDQQSDQIFFHFIVTTTTAERESDSNLLFLKHAAPKWEMSTVREVHLTPTNLSSLNKYDNDSSDSQELSRAWQLNRIKLLALRNVKREEQYLWTRQSWPNLKNKIKSSAFSPLKLSFFSPLPLMMCHRTLQMLLYLRGLCCFRPLALTSLEGWPKNAFPLGDL